MSRILFYCFKTLKFKYSRAFFKKIILKMENGWAFSPTIRKIYSTFYGINIGYGTYGGCFDKDNIPRGVSFGNYCSIASGVKIFRANHLMANFTTHPILYNPIFKYVEKDMLVRPALQIGHDVWIGCNVIILPNVYNIGDGAIIGAGSIVTKDVEAFTIIAGNPAKILRKRFPKRTINKINKSNWYHLHYCELTNKIDDFQKLVDE